MDNLIKATELAPHRLMHPDLLKLTHPSVDFEEEEDQVPLTGTNSKTRAIDREED